MRTRIRIGPRRGELRGRPVRACRCNQSGDLQTRCCLRAAYAVALGDKDPLYALRHSRRNFNGFFGTGGPGTFESYSPPPDLDGYSIYLVRSLWGSAMECCLARIVAPWRSDDRCDIGPLAAYLRLSGSGQDPASWLRPGADQKPELGVGESIMRHFTGHRLAKARTTNAETTGDEVRKLACW